MVDAKGSWNGFSIARYRIDCEMLTLCIEEPVAGPIRPASPMFVLTDFDEGQVNIAHHDFGDDTRNIQNDDQVDVVSNASAAPKIEPASSVEIIEHPRRVNLRPNARPRSPVRESAQAGRRSNSQDEKRQSFHAKFRQRLSAAGIDHGIQDFASEALNRSFKTNAEAKLRQPWAPIVKKLQQSRWSMTITRPTPTQERVSVDIVIIHLYNGGKNDKSRHTDTEMHMNQQQAASFSARDEAGSTKRTVPGRLNAVMQQRPILPLTEDRNDAVKNKGSQNWSWDSDTVQQCGPHCEVIDVGFNIAGASPEHSDIEIAAKELNTYLQDLRDQIQTPVLFVGLGLGSLIAMRCLSTASRDSPPERVLSCTAGFFMLGDCLVSRDNYTRALRSLYGSEIEKISIDNLFDCAFEEPGDFLQRGMFARVLEDETVAEKRPSIGVASTASHQIPFPIVQVLSPEDGGVSIARGLRNRFGGSIRTVFMPKKFETTRRFYGQDEEHFRQFMTLIRSTLSANPLIRAAAAGPNATKTTIRTGVDVNSRFRW